MTPVLKSAPPGAEPLRTAESVGWLSLREVAARLSVTVRRVEGWVSHPTHPLPSVLLGGRRVVHRQDLARWLSRGARGGATLPGV